mgnify:CR=1 FL=1
MASGLRSQKLPAIPVMELEIGMLTLHGLVNAIEELNHEQVKVELLSYLPEEKAYGHPRSVILYKESKIKIITDEHKFYWE